MSPQRDRPQNDAECARMDAMLSRFRSAFAMNNREELDGFLAALICSPDIAKPSEYLPDDPDPEMRPSINIDVERRENSLRYLGFSEERGPSSARTGLTS
jgi:hypothetical protein